MSGSGVFPKSHIPAISAEEWDLVGEEFERIDPGRDVMPHVLGNATGLDYKLARALLLALGLHGLAENWLYVYHVCAEAPVTARRLSEGFQPVPWQCPHCEHFITSQNELRYDLVCRPREKISFG